MLKNFSNETTKYPNRILRTPSFIKQLSTRFKTHKTQETISKQDMVLFIQKDLPIFWVMGPPHCGTSTLAEMLARSSKYNLVKVSKLIKDEADMDTNYSKIIQECMDKYNPVPDKIVVSLLKEHLLLKSEKAQGFIIDGFPLSLHQAKLFEKTICPIKMVIYVTLILDAVLARVIRHYDEVDVEYIRMQHVKYTKRLNSIYQKYEHKAIKLNSNYPPEDTCTKLVENLEDFWGYKFLRLFVKN